MKPLRVLVACEYSGTVRDAFTRLGHYAMSVDLLPTESTGNHYQGNVFDVLNGSWDLMIAHPPCTYLSRAANRVWNTPGRKEKREQALEFFKKLYYAPIPHICIENPLGYVSEVFIKYDQIIHPYYFGDQEMKRTCLWLRNLPPLIHATEDELFYKKSHTSKPQPFGYTTSGKAKYFMDKCKGGGDLRRKNRAKFWPGIAEAMAKQWSEYVQADRSVSYT